MVVAAWSSTSASAPLASCARAWTLRRSRWVRIWSRSRTRPPALASRARLELLDHLLAVVVHEAPQVVHRGAARLERRDDEARGPELDVAAHEVEVEGRVEAVAPRPDRELDGSGVAPGLAGRRAQLAEAERQVVGRDHVGVEPVPEPPGAARGGGAAAADQDRRPPGLRRLRVAAHALEAHVAAAVGRGAGRPEGAHRLDRLVETSPAVAVGHADRRVLLLLPADADAEE